MRLAVCLYPLVLAASLRAQETPRTVEAIPPLEKRALGVIPNYRLADGNAPYVPITAKEKWHIAFKDSTDFPVFPTAAVFAGIYHWENQNPSFGQGMKGYGHRFVTAYGDQAIGNFMIEGFLPSVLHEDPRYFARGTGHGSTKSRLWYAATRIFINRTDHGTNSFNFSEFLGNAAMAGIGNAYYPDSRRLSNNFGRFYIALGTDSLGFVLKEFSPDIKRAFIHKKKDSAVPLK